MKIIDIIAIVFILLGGYLGFRKGAIKGTIELVALLAIAIVSYQFKGFLSTFFIKTLPFFNFAGDLQGIYAVNVGIYDAASFFIIFVLLYCILNILMAISGFVDVLSKAAVLLEIPSKIIGVLAGALNSIIVVFVAGVLLLEVAQTQGIVMQSTFVKNIVERSPIVNVIFKDVIASSENIYFAIKDEGKEEDKTNVNVSILTYYVRYGVSTSTIIQGCIDEGKLNLNNVTIAS